MTEPLKQAAELYVQATNNGDDRLYIETYDGTPFYLRRPEFNIASIAHSLGNQCRYCGHCLDFYSVAEHSLLCAAILLYFDIGSPYEALMHDAHEAYWSDVPSPWKVVLPDYKTHESALELAMRRWAGLPDKISEEAKLADWTALWVECQTLVTTKAASWPFPERVVEFGKKFIKEFPERHMYLPREATKNFLYSYNQLRP